MTPEVSLKKQVNEMSGYIVNMTGRFSTSCNQTFVAKPSGTRHIARNLIEMKHLSIFENKRKSWSECSPKLEVLQDPGFQRNIAYEFDFQTVYLPMDWIILIRCSLHFSSSRLSPIVLTCTSNATPLASL